MLENMDELPVRDAGLQARPQDRELLHRLSQAPLHLALYRPRLQIALHLLPVAADHRRPQVPHPQRRERGRGDRLGEEGDAAGQGILLRRRHLHRQSAARRSDRPRTRQDGRHLVVQRQGQRAARDAESDARQRVAAAAGRLRDRQSADPLQHQEGHAHRRRPPLHQGLPRAGHHHPRHLYPRPAGRDARNHPGDHPFRQGDQSAHLAGFAGRALSGHLPLQAGAGERLARHRPRRTDRRSRRAGGAAALSASEPLGDFPLGRGVLQPILSSRAQDRLDRVGNGSKPGNAEAPACARGSNSSASCASGVRSPERALHFSAADSRPHETRRWRP